MKIAVILNGEKITNLARKKMILEADLVIAADGGINICRFLGIMPDILIGDMDSLGVENYKVLSNSLEVIKLDPKKDATDGEFAIELAVTRGASEIMIFAAFGDRIDHSLANIFMAAKYLSKDLSISLIGNNAIAYYSIGDISLTTKIGKTVSLIPLTDEVCGVCTCGLEYSLVDYDMEKFSSLGMSNVAIAEEVKISHASGILLIVVEEKY